jgi:hypothetical protein
MRAVFLDFGTVDNGDLDTQALRQALPGVQVDWLVEQSFVESEVAPHLPHARVEVGGTQRQPSIEGIRVPVVRARFGRRQRRGRCIEFGLRGCDATAPRQERADGFARRSIGFLREQAHVGGAGRDLHGSPIEVDTSGERPEQRRLADAIRADEADAVTGGQGEIDIVEHDERTSDDGE